MKQYVLLTVCAYVTCFGAASSKDAGALQTFTQSFLRSPKAQEPDIKAALERGIDPGYIAFMCSKSHDPSVVVAVAPHIGFLMGRWRVPYQFFCTSIGKRQLFGCLIIGSQPKRAAHLVQAIRSHWDRRLSGYDYELFKRSECQHYIHPLCKEDVQNSLMTEFRINSRFTSDVKNKKLITIFFAASELGVQIFFLNYNGIFEAQTDNFFGKHIFAVDGALNLHDSNCPLNDGCLDPAFSISFATQHIKNFFRSTCAHHRRS